MNGILPLLKPKGMTSHDCVAKVRKMLHTKKVGHTGTLDPDVEGVLPLCIGKATKIVEYLTEATKTYEAEITLGASTTTEDASGEIIETKEITNEISEQQLKQMLREFEGESKQVPPMYSAVKIKGRKLYEYAREGIEVERPTRIITIHSISLLENGMIINNSNRSFRIRVTCSKGTYIRTLAVDIGKRLGYPSYMSHLIRTKSGEISIDECITFDQIDEQLENNMFSLIPIEKAIAFMEKYTVDEGTKVKVLHGAILPIPDQMIIKKHIGVYDIHGNCIAIYQEHPSRAGFMKPHKVF